MSAIWLDPNGCDSNSQTAGDPHRETKTETKEKLTNGDRYRKAAGKHRQFIESFVKIVT